MRTRSRAPRLVSGNRNRQHSCNGQSCDENRCGLAETGNKGVPTTEPHELCIGRSDPGDSIVLSAVGDELRCAPKELDELGSELSARRGLPAPHESTEPRRDEGDGGSSEHQTDCEDGRGGRKDESRRQHARCGDDERDHGRCQAAEVQPLESVDVTDHPADEIAAPKCISRQGPAVRCARMRSPGSAPVHGVPDRAMRAARGTSQGVARARGSGRGR